MTTPDFLIVGAAKAGTTSLYKYLDQHPEIFMTTPKEPCFFAFANEQIHFYTEKPAFITNPADYLKLFNDCGNAKCRGEASTPYLYLYRKTIDNIQKYISESHKYLKIIILLRNPVERAFSQYVMYRALGLENLNFRDAVNAEKSRMAENYHFDYFYVDRGNYYHQVKAYSENFQQIQIILFDDFTDNPEKTIRDCFKFLNIDEKFNCKT